MRIREKPPVSRTNRFGLAGVDVRELERRMRPGGWSVSGFISGRDSLTSVLQRDEATIVGWLGTNRPKEVDKAYRTFANLLRKIREAGPEQEVIVNGRRFFVHHAIFLGAQDCPYNDGFKTGSEFYIVDIQTGHYRLVSDLLPHLIEAHRFFEGNVRYRFGPGSIVRAFNLKPGAEPEIEMVESSAYARYKPQYSILHRFHRMLLFKSEEAEAREQMREIINQENLPDIPQSHIESFWRFVDEFPPKGSGQQYLKITSQMSALNAELVRKTGVLPLSTGFFMQTPYLLHLHSDYRFQAFAAEQANALYQQVSNIVIG